MKIYRYEEVLKASTEYFDGSDLSARAFTDKYALRNEQDELIEVTPDDMHRRIAKEFVRIEKGKFKTPLSEEKIYLLLKDFHYIIPQGSPMYGIGNPKSVSLSNCYVLESPIDSYGGIFNTDQQIAQTSKRRGGIGLDISYLRPAGMFVNNSARTTSGAISFMERFSNTLREVGQHGRRGAGLFSISIHHPDILDFIDVKRDHTKVTGANISIRLTQEFIEALEKNKDYEVRFPIDSEAPEISRQLSAKLVWDKIIQGNWESGDPGLQIWDNIIKNSPADCYVTQGFRTVSTNPCGEIPLCEGDSCRLLLLNAYSYVISPFTKHSSFNYKLFYTHVKIAQRLMDNLIDLELEKIEGIIKKIKKDKEPDHIKGCELRWWKLVREKCKEGRRTGTGLTAIGDVLAALNIPYDGKKGIKTVGDIYQVLKFAAYESSIDMAEELGPFPIWDSSLEGGCEFFQRFASETLDVEGVKKSGKNLINKMGKVGRRNIALLTTAPAGTVSMMCQTTSGIEPAFELSYIRKKKGNPGDENFRTDSVDQNGDHWMHFEVFHPKVKIWKGETGEKDLKKSPWICANDIGWENRIKLQSIAQSHVDHAISSTINLPNDVKVETIDKIYRIGIKSGLKGITVYRDGSKTGVLIREEEEKEKEKKKKIGERPRELPCEIHHIMVKGDPYFVLVGMYNGEPYEVFAGRNNFLDKKLKYGKIIRKKKGWYKVEFEDDTELSPITSVCDDYDQITSRLTSALLRGGTDMHYIVDQLEKVSGEMNGLSKSIARALKKYIKDGSKVNEVCPECGADTLIRLEGCKTCRSCVWSKCI